MLTRQQAIGKIKKLPIIPRTMAITYSLEYLTNGESPHTIIQFLLERYGRVTPVLHGILWDTLNTEKCKECGKEHSEDKMLGYKLICKECTCKDSIDWSDVNSAFNDRFNNKCSQCDLLYDECNCMS